MGAQAYLELKKKHEEELNAFPIAYAFNEEQLAEALEKLGATKEECVSLWNCGDILKKSDIPAFKEMLKRQRVELREALKDEEFAEEAFLYEMDNHEYCINWSGDDDVLDSLELTFDLVDELGLRSAYLRARRKHMKRAEELGII